GSACVREEQGRGDQGALGVQRDQLAGAEAARTGRVPRYVQLLVQRQRRGVPGRRRGGSRRRARRGIARRKALAGTRSSNPDQRPGDFLLKVLYPKEPVRIQRTAPLPAGAIVVGAQPQNDPRIPAALEPIRVKYHLPALGGAIVTSKGLTALAVTGVRKAGTD